jgi:ATP-dependent Clp protease ATP-binding subunit ClpB
MAGIKRVLDPTRISPSAEALEQAMHQRVVGQDQAIHEIVAVYQTFLSGMAAPGRPVGSLLFLGPTGSGKTRAVEALAEGLTGDARAITKIDCAEFQHSHEIAKLIGSPPGYLGHRETHALLSQEVLDQYYTPGLKLSFVLFDEIEKASDALWNLLLGILDKATLTLGDNKRVDFSRTLIFMTGNLGAAEMSSMLQPKLGFAARAGVPASPAAVSEKLAHVATEAARRRFTPEFLNRIDRVVTFRPLGEPELDRILDLEVDAVEERLLRATGPGVTVLDLSPETRVLLLREGTDARYGARHLKRAIERRLVQPLSNLIATGQVAAGDHLFVDCDCERLVFSKEPADVAIAAA